MVVQAGFEPEAPSSPNIPRSARSFSRNSGESRYRRIRSPMVRQKHRPVRDSGKGIDLEIIPRPPPVGDLREQIVDAPAGASDN